MLHTLFQDTYVQVWPHSIPCLI